MKTERNVKFISNIAEVHPKSPTGNLVKTERNVKFISIIAEKRRRRNPPAPSLSYSRKLFFVREEIFCLISLNEEFSEDVSSGLW